jgi:hypothetical protein
MYNEHSFTRRKKNMSTYESEWGNIQFTKTGYMQFVRTFRKEYNLYIGRVHAINSAIHQHLSSIKGAGSTQKRKDAFDRLHHASPVSNYGLGLRAGDCIKEYAGDIYYTVRDEMFRGKGETLTQPRKQSFPTLTNKQVSFTIAVGDEGALTFTQQDNGGGIAWHVEENNHAVDNAHAHVLYQLFSKVISNYKWKGKEGGVFYYESEYTRDGARESGGGDTTSESAQFGPEGKAHQVRKMKALRAMYA